MLLTTTLATLAVASPLGGAAPPPAPPDAAVEVWDRSGDRPRLCPPISVAPNGRPEGGCTLPVRSGPVRMRVLTAVGDVDFATCRYPHRLRVDGSGRTMMERIVEKGRRPCNDIVACMTASRKPWPGQIAWTGSGYRHEVQACFDTCMGQFRGRASMDLTVTAQGWRETVSAPLTLGQTGFELAEARWDVGARALTLRPADRRSAGGSRLPADR
jgi:hypothetical protein